MLRFDKIPMSIGYASRKNAWNWLPQPFLLRICIRRLPVGNVSWHIKHWYQSLHLPWQVINILQADRVLGNVVVETAALWQMKNFEWKTSAQSRTNMLDEILHILRPFIKTKCMNTRLIEHRNVVKVENIEYSNEKSQKLIICPINLSY